jgi:two-component system KDP operon response regulator KdpE
VIRSLRPWYGAPILVLSARGQEHSKVEALDTGADDYLTKPFSVPELLARMRVALRHAARSAAGPSDAPFEAGPLRVDLVARRVTLDGDEVHLTPIEFKLLAVLVRNAGMVVTQRQMLQEVWGPQSLDQAHYLRVYMTHLRRKLEPGPPAERLFKTEAGVGYRLELPE